MVRLLACVKILFIEISPICAHSTEMRFYDGEFPYLFNRMRHRKVVEAMNVYVDTLLLKESSRCESLSFSV